MPLLTQRIKLLEPHALLLFLILYTLFCFPARAGLLHLQSPRQQQPHRGTGAAAAALQRGPTVGDDRGAAVPDALQEGPAHQEVHQDRCTVSSFAHIPV